MADSIPDLAPVALAGLTWRQARSALDAVDCALTRPHWCIIPGVVLRDDELLLDADGEIAPFRFMPGDRSACDWMMVPRVDNDGRNVPLTYRKVSSHA